jgi:2-octaprenyl-6-methoxyphenol hydroxylase
MDYDSDVLIVGGGLVGASLACALGKAGMEVAVVEAHTFRIDAQPNYDERSIALAQGSQRIFSGLGLWGALADQVCPIHTIHVSDRGRFGFTRLRREEEGVPALGYVASARILGNTLIEGLHQLPGVRLMAPARLSEFRIGSDAVEADLETEGASRTHRARLLVAADGVNSAVRDRLGIRTRQWDYGQTAVIANVTPEQPHDNVAYERFTDTGPMALLPLLGDYCALVWTVRSQQAEELLALDDAQFLARLQHRFGYRLGRFVQVGERHAYRLQLLRARESIRPRLALLGNAVHTLHPVAGQGFNLGLRDVAALAEVVIDARRGGTDIGDIGVLKRYADWRQADQRRVVAFTDGMVRLFSQPLPPVAWLRDAGMLALDLFPPAKRWFGRMTMGRAGRLPRLARGLEL